MRLQLFGRERLLRRSCEQGENLLDHQLRGEALGGGDGALASSLGGHGEGRLAGHGGILDVGDGQGQVAGIMGFAQRGQGVGGLTGLGDDDDGSILPRLLGAVAVFAGVFDVDGDAAEVFDADLGDQSGVAGWSRWR